MYSSNQILDVTCDARDLGSALDFAIKLYGEDIFTRDDGRIKMAFAELRQPADTMPNAYLLGWGTMEPYRTGDNKDWAASPAKGWTDYPFDYEPDLVARVVAQWAMKQDVEMPDIDGTVTKGIRMMSVGAAYENGPLPMPYSIRDIDMDRAILAFTAYPLEYAK